MATRAIAVVEDAASGIQFRERSGESRARGLAVIGVGGRGDELLGEGRVAHVVEFAFLVQLPVRLTHIPVLRQLDENPLARLALLSAQLRQDAVTVEDFVGRNFHAREFGERRHEVRRVHHVVRDFAHRRHAGPVCDERDVRAAFEHRALRAGEGTATDGSLFRPTLARAVVAHENEQRLLAQLQPFEFGHEFADQLVHVGHVIHHEVRRVRRAVGRALEFGVNVRHRVVDVEWLVLILRDEVHEMRVHQLGHVFLVGQSFFHAIHNVFLRLRLVVAPIHTAAAELQVVIETKLRRPERELAPLADHGEDVTGRFQMRGHEGLHGVLHAAGRVLVRRAGAEGVAARQDQRARRPAQRSGVTRAGAYEL